MSNLQRRISGTSRWRQSLKRNTFLNEVSELFPKSSYEEKCDVCKLKEVYSQAVSMCIQCRDLLCERCAQIHCGGSTLMVGHRVVAIEDVKSGLYLAEIQRSKKVTCPSHPDKIMEIYCESCKKPVCFACFAVEHPQHKMNYVDKATKGAHKVVKGLSEPWSEAVEHCEMLSDGGKGILEDLDKQEAHATKEIRKMYGDVKVEIETQENASISKLKQQVATAREQVETWCKEVEIRKATIASTLEYATNVFDSAQDVEKLRQFEDIKTRLQGLDVKSIETQTRKPVLTLQPTKIAIPDLKVDVVTQFETIEVVSKLRKRMDDQPTRRRHQRPPRPVSMRSKAKCVQRFNTHANDCYGLTASGNWIITTGAGTRKVKVFDKHSCTLFFEVKQDLHTLKAPCGVTYNKQTGDAFITDDGIKGVVRYDSKGKVVKVTPDLYRMQGMVTCLNDQLIITDRQGERVLITDLDCNVKQTVTKSSLGLEKFNPWYVCVNNHGDLVVGDYDNKSVYVTSTQPSLKQIFDTHFKPGGVCVDQWGHVLVVDSSDARVVLLTDPKVKERVAVASNDFHHPPTDLAVTAPGQIAVLENYGNVKIFQYVDMK